jgi:uncharacterized OB-fold protein
MSGEVNVVARWRERALSLGRQGWRCAACTRVSLVRRRLCAGCGAAGPMARAPLAARGVIRAATPAGAAVEHLDQVTGRKAAVWVELDGGGALACLLSHADSIALLPHSRGQSVRLAVRRTALGGVGEGDPIAYGLKAALDLESRGVIKSQIEAARAARNSKDQE